MSWIVSVAKPRCTLCEVCVRKCPTGALSYECASGIGRIYFDSTKCDGCSETFPCKVLCPEFALEISLKKIRQNGKTLLMAGRLVQCSDCKVPFTPQKKSARVAAKKTVRRLCPSCRRRSLLSAPESS